MTLDLYFRHKRLVALTTIVGFVLFALYLFLFTDFAGVALVIGGTNVPIYALAFVGIVLSVVLHTLTWQRILDGLEVKLGFRRLFSLSWVGVLVDAVIPGGWSGDIFKTYLLAKEQPGAGPKLTASIVIKNVFEIVLTLIALVLGIFLLVFNYWITDVVVFAIVLTLLLLVLPLGLVMYLSVDLEAAKKLFRLTQRLLGSVTRKPLSASGPSEAETKIQNQLREYHDGIMIMKTNPRVLVRPAIFQTLTWVVDVVTRLLVFVAIGYAISPDKIIITNTIVVGIQTQGVAFASLAQIVSSSIYSVLGISPIVSVASSLLAGFATFWARTAIAFVFFEVVVFSYCVPFFCKKCGSWGRKKCDTNAQAEEAD
jgi:uncharacterized protein (TIRG00374 family)